MKVHYIKFGILLGISLTYFSSWSQFQKSGKIEYNVTYHRKSFIPQNFTGELTFDSNKTIFMYDKNTFTTAVKKDSIHNNGQKTIMMSKGRITDNIGNITYTNFETKQQVSRELIQRKPFIVDDTIVSPVWNIGTDVRNIGNYKCQNAFTTYYGREYEVWFTNNIPVGYGPWKLNGLPGLILEAKSKDGELIFEATKVALSKTTEVIEPPESGTYIKSYAAFRELQDQKLEDLRKFGQSKLNEIQKPGTKMKLTGVSFRRFEKTPQ
ncbi:MAG: GLPGLI family protein [Niabella sp.]